MMLLMRFLLHYETFVGPLRFGEPIEEGKVQVDVQMLEAVDVHSQSS
jgi:hypothetical protein